MFQLVLETSDGDLLVSSELFDSFEEAVAAAKAKTKGLGEGETLTVEPF